ncbi:MAG: hypothetical protein NVS4B11_21940 [Ktedonobacteraceae bacterium]
MRIANGKHPKSDHSQDHPWHNKGKEFLGRYALDTPNALFHDFSSGTATRHEENTLFNEET